MEIFDTFGLGHILTAFTLIGGTIWVGFLTLFRFIGLTRILAVASGSVTKIVQTAFEQRTMSILIDRKQVPKIHVPRNPKDFEMLGSVLSHRILLYTDVFETMKVPFHGAYAISFRLSAFYRPEFIMHLDMRKRDFEQLTSCLDEYLNLRSKLKQEFDEQINHTQEKINRFDLLLKRLELQIQSYGIARYNALSWETWRACREIIRKKKKLGLAIRKKRSQAEKQLKKTHQDVFDKYSEKIILLAVRIIQLDEQRLRMGIHELEADFAVSKASVHSGRMFNDLIKSNDKESQAARELLKLPEDFPLDDVAAAKIYMLSYLNGRAALSNTPAREDLLECFLRTWLEEVQTETFTSHFLHSLPLPGGLGLAQAKFGHKVGTRGSWLKPAPQKRGENGQFLPRDTSKS